MCRRLTYLFCVSCLMVLLAAPDVKAQNFSGYNWYFGNTTRGIQFSRSTDLPQLINNKAPLGMGGSAVASDQINGNLLFYTDGATVYNASNVPMPNGNGLSGDPSRNQPVAIAKIPGVENQFYIFHCSAVGALQVTVVDMTLIGGAVPPSPPSGNVTIKNDASIGLAGRSEAMLTIPHANGENAWLITHVAGSPNYTVTLIEAAGAFTNTTFSGLGLIESAASFSYHALTGRIAVAPKEVNRDVEIFDFDNATGVLTFNQRVLGSGVATMASGEALFDTEWSNSGHYLYISRHGDAGIQADVIQFDTRTALVTLASALPQPNAIFRSYGIQLAPDSVMYHLYQATNAGPFLIGGFTDTDTVAAEVQYVSQAFAGALNFNGRQFPQFAPTDTVGFNIGFTPVTTCQNAPTTIFPTVSPAADSLVWDFGDGIPVTSWSPIRTFETAGSIPISVTAFLNGQPSTPFIQNMNVTAFDLQITLVSDTTACSCNLDFPKAPSPPPRCPDDFIVTADIQGGSSPTMQWYGPEGAIPGATSASLTVPEAGYYYLVVQDASGCSTYAGVNVKEYGVVDQRANIWHFGQNAGIDFNPVFDNPPTPAVALNGPLNTPEGCAVISDRNGQVILSTDGRSVFDGTGADITPAPNPPGIGGEPGATQSSLIVPVPGDETLYYIFTTQEVQGTNTYQLKYSLFDLKLNGGTGDIVESNILLFAKSTERIVSNGNWLIAHEYGNNSFRAYQITAEGISNPVISSIGSVHSFSTEANGQGYMELGGNSMLAVALSTPGVSNVVEIFDFVDSSGTVVNFRRADLQTPAGQVYGLEFSGDKLYASVKNAGTSKIVELFFDTQDIPQLVNFPPDQFMTVAGEVGAIQRGPDGQIYVAVNGSGFLGVIQPSADTLTISTFNANGFQLAAGTTSTLGLPNFIQVIADPFQGPDITVTGICEDDSVNFAGTPTDPIDKFFWQIRTAGGTVLTASNEQSFNFFFADPGQYEAVLRLTNDCGLDTTLIEAFEIFAKPDPITQGSMEICLGPVTLEAHDVDDPTLTYLWSPTNETTRTIVVDEFGQFSVTKTNAAGCSVSGEIFVVDSRPQLDLGPDITICENVAIADLDALNPVAGTTYSWTINGAPVGNTQTQDVDTSVPGVFTYAVTVTSPAGPGGGCVATEDKVFTINEAPAFLVTPTNPSSCISNDGSIRIDFQTPLNTLFSYFVVGPSPASSGSDQSPGSFVATPANLAPGIYGITVSDQVTGCAISQTASITNNDFAITSVVKQNACNPVNLVVTHNSALPFTLDVIDATTGAAVVSNVSGSGSPFPIPNPINAGSYHVTMRSGGCTVSTTTPITVTQDPLQPINSFTANGCDDPITVTVNSPGATSFNWTTAPGILSGAGTASITADPPQGAQTYIVTVDGPATCPNTGQIIVNVDNALAPDFPIPDLCQSQVTLSATPSGPYIYQWTRDGLAAGGGQQLVITQGGTYQVTLTSTVSGCFKDSPAKPVQLLGVTTIQANFPTPLPCENQPFTITTVSNKPGGTYKWFFNGSEIGGATGINLTDTRGGTYRVDYLAAGCPATASIVVTPAPADPGKLFDDAIICPEEANPDPTTRQVILDAGAGFTSYAWFKDGVSLGETTQAITVTEKGLYSVDLVNVFGCESSDKTQVDVECHPKIVAPTAFRPASDVEGGSGLANREFGILSYFIDDDGFQVFIFNRWGELIFQSNDRQFRWNGAYNNIGPLLPAGTYSYVVRYKSEYRPEDGIKEKRGGVVLVR
jgi:large repetitive protein